MTVEQIDAILKALRQKMGDEEDDATFYAMRDASKAIRAWQAEGGSDEIPYQNELRQWELLPTSYDGYTPVDESVGDTIVLPLSAEVESSEDRESVELDQPVTVSLEADGGKGEMLTADDELIDALPGYNLEKEKQKKRI